MTIQDLKEKKLILFECISGSKAYGLDLPGSDTDIRGIFYLPKEKFLGFGYIPQISSASNDEVYYELGRFLELLKKNNPNILEILATPEDMILYKHPIINKIDPDVFISKRCKDTFAGYAFTQIKKARGLNKKIVNPIDKQKKTILDFCYVLYNQGSVSLKKWLDIKSINQADCGLVNVPHAMDIYGIFVDQSRALGFKGIMKKENATSVLLSSIPKNEKVSGHLYFNNDGYIKYCKDYKDYWDWVEKRNESRYQNNVEHGKNYDSKNMMHTFRLLDMSIEILKTGKVNVRRPNREELLRIRRGEYRYEELVQMVDEKMKEVDEAYRSSTIPDEPDDRAIERLLVSMRKELYNID